MSQSLTSPHCDTYFVDWFCLHEQTLFLLWILFPGTSLLTAPIICGKLRTVGYFVLECKSFTANTYFPVQRPERQVYSVHWKSWGGRPSLRYGIHLAAVTNLSPTRRNDATRAGYQWQPMAQQSLQLMTDIASTVRSVTTSPTTIALAFNSSILMLFYRMWRHKTISYEIFAIS